MKRRESLSLGKTSQLGTLLLVLSAVLALVAIALTGPAMADDGDDDGCCVCDCSDPAATAQLPPVEDGLCFDGPGIACASLCQSEGCAVTFFTPVECSLVSGCAQAAGRHMAPAASPFILAAIAAALAILGVSTIRR